MKHAAHERARARRYAMQALYQWDLSGEQASAIRAQFLEAEDFSRAPANLSSSPPEDKTCRREARSRCFAVSRNRCR